MTYTKQVREYCETHKGTLIDVSKVKDEDFSEIPYKTLLKILNRLEEENIVHTVSKEVSSCVLDKNTGKTGKIGL